MHLNATVQYEPRNLLALCEPLAGTPEAPQIIQPTGRKRRNDNFPSAPELTTPVLERLYSGEDGSTKQRRRLQQQDTVTSSDDRFGAGQQQQHFDYAAAFAASYTGQPAAVLKVTGPASTDQQHLRGVLKSHSSSSSSSAGGGGVPRQLRQQVNKPFDYAAAFAASYATAERVQATSKRTARRRIDPTVGATTTTTTTARNGSNRKLQQAPASKQRPGWTGLWWADAGGVGVAAGPAHAVHTISTVMAVYTLDPATGNQIEQRVVALQDLFAPVGAANCK
jgi:hypothetical protein